MVYIEVTNADCFKSLPSHQLHPCPAHSKVFFWRSDKRLEWGHVWYILALPMNLNFRKNLEINKPSSPTWLLGLTFPSTASKPPRHMFEGKCRDYHCGIERIIILNRNLGFAWEGMLDKKLLTCLEDRQHWLGQATASNSTTWNRKDDGQSYPGWLGAH